MNLKESLELSFWYYLFTSPVLIGIYFATYNIAKKHATPYNAKKRFLIFLCMSHLHFGLYAVGTSHGGGCLPIPCIWLLFLNVAWSPTTTATTIPIGILILFQLIISWILLHNGFKKGEMLLFFDNTGKTKFLFTGPASDCTIDGKKVSIATGQFILASENDPQILLWIKYGYCTPVKDTCPESPTEPLK